MSDYKYSQEFNRVEKKGVLLSPLETFEIIKELEEYTNKQAENYNIILTELFNTRKQLKEAYVELTD